MLLAKSSGEKCPACGYLRADHIDPPAPPRIKGHLGATENRPGLCLIKNVGKVPHR